MGWAAGEKSLVFYANDGRIAGWNHKWVQDVLTFMVAMFRRMGLDTNLEDTKSMFCMPVFIWSKWSEKAYKLQVIGEGATFREKKRMRVSCTECGVAVAALYQK